MKERMNYHLLSLTKAPAINYTESSYPEAFKSQVEGYDE
jgi:hypothetical protein